MDTLYQQCTTLRRCPLKHTHDNAHPHAHAPAHLERGEEAGLDEGRLVLTQAGGHVARHAEVGVLVDGAGHEAADVLARAKHVRERVGEGRRRLHGGEGDLPDVVVRGQPKDALDLVHGHAPKNEGMNERSRGRCEWRPGAGLSGGGGQECGRTETCSLILCPTTTTHTPCPRTAGSAQCCGKRRRRRSRNRKR